MQSDVYSTSLNAFLPEFESETTLRSFYMDWQGETVFLFLMRNTVNPHFSSLMPFCNSVNHLSGVSLLFEKAYFTFQELHRLLTTFSKSLLHFSRTTLPSENVFQELTSLFKNCESGEFTIFHDTFLLLTSMSHFLPHNFLPIIEEWT